MCIRDSFNKFIAGSMLEAMPGDMACRYCSESHKGQHWMALRVIQEHIRWDVADIDSLYNREEYLEKRGPLYGQLD
eukprot:7145660-Karenia_brevis.AAC.1